MRRAPKRMAPEDRVGQLSGRYKPHTVDRVGACIPPESASRCGDIQRIPYMAVMISSQLQHNIIMGIPARYPSTLGHENQAADHSPSWLLHGLHDLITVAYFGYAMA